MNPYTQIKKAIFACIWKRYKEYIERCIWRGDDITKDFFKKRNEVLKQ